MFSMIACVDSEGGIGLNGEMPWHLKKDLKHFVDKTQNTTCVFGYKTWHSLPDFAKSRLRDKSYVFVYNQTPMFHPEGVAHIRDDGFYMLQRAIICGGAKLYEWAFQNLQIDNIYLTIIDNDYKCDTFFPKQYLNWYAPISTEVVRDFDFKSGLTRQLTFREYRRKDL